MKAMLASTLAVAEMREGRAPTMVLLARDKIDLGVPRHHRLLLSPRREARTAKSVIQGTPPLSRLSGGDVHGHHVRAVLRARRAQANGRGMCVGPGIRAPACQGGPHVRHNDGRLSELGDWLAEKGVTHVALESTGVYWHAVLNLLEGNVELLLVNAQHIKQVPGRLAKVRGLIR